MDLDEMFFPDLGFHSGYDKQLDQIQLKLG